MAAFEQVPAEICGSCGEYDLGDVVTCEILERAEKAVESGAEVEIRRYAA